MIRELYATIRSSGLGNIILFLGIVISIILMVVNAFYPIKIKGIVEDAFYIFVLTILAQLLYFKLEDRSKGKKSDSFINSGILDALPRLDSSDLKDVLIPNKKNVLFNGWIYNIESAMPIIVEILKEKNTSVEICVVSPESDFVGTREIELGLSNIKSQLYANREQLYYFLLSLDERDRSKVKIYEVNTFPKFIIYGTKEKAAIGFYFPKTHGVHAPFLVLSDSHGYFSEKIWSYYDELEKTEITNSLDVRT